jgi:PAS domain S-box-containing protein/putative nucleotidyltransferase with HDIG domain
MLLENNTQKKILIAEDSKSQAKILTETLSKSGYAVTLAEDGLAGLYKLTKSKPDLVISDVWMPKMNGYELCRTLKNDRELRDIPVILLTSMSDLEDIIKGLEAGADYYITKPYDKDILLDKVALILSGIVPAVTNDSRIPVEIKTNGKAHSILLEPQKIVNFLLSTYENLLSQNRDLVRTKVELKKLNDHLEERVREKTGYLEKEIAERKKTQYALIESETRYRSIFENAIEGIFQSTPEGRLISGNPALARMYGYESPQDLLEITDIAKQLYVDPEDRNVFKEILEKHGCIAQHETQRYRKDGTRIWVSSNARVVRDPGGKLLYYEGTVEDITESKETEEALRKSFEHLKKTLDGTVRALATTIEIRDPYTAGHQRRVAQLACAIVKEMGFAEDRLEGMQVMGFLHDIGKIVVPAEILSKPGVLNELEFNMIKAHAQVGYNILQGIEFPWPVNDAVLQHHERLNGSGYPQGLTKEGIIVEARILAVADVVESMASHRPYRPALGMDKALEEVTQKKGILYDEEVVDACVRIFTEKGFKLE